MVRGVFEIQIEEAWQHHGARLAGQAIAGEGGGGGGGSRCRQSHHFG